jgi:hypothetical protein
MEAAQSILSIQGESIILSATKPRFIVRSNEAAEFNGYAIISIGFLLWLSQGALLFAVQHLIQSGKYPLLRRFQCWP